jgi:hypothetical protein
LKPDTYNQKNDGANLLRQIGYEGQERHPLSGSENLPDPAEPQRPCRIRYQNEGFPPQADQCSGFSAASGLKSGQSNRKRNSEKANIEYRIMNVEYRSNVFCLF